MEEETTVTMEAYEQKKAPCNFYPDMSKINLIYPTRTLEVAYKEPLWLKRCTCSAV